MMANATQLYLKTADLLGIFNSLQNYEPSVQDALYEQYKAAYKLSVSNYMRGDSVDAFKSYFSNGTINMISGLLDISSEITMIFQLITETFYQYESAAAGKVKFEKLDDIKTEWDGHKSKFDSLAPELNSVNAAASQYISIVSINDDVTASYTDLFNAITDIKDNLTNADNGLKESVSELSNRISELKTLIDNTMGLCYAGGTFDSNAAANLTSQEWYKQQTNATLFLLLTEDPFEYEAGAVSVAEDQWAAGLCSDVYAYAGYSFLSASYEAGAENGSVFVNARASVLELNGYAQLTDYLRAEGEVRVFYAEGDAKAGAGPDYFGAHVKYEAGVAKVNGKVVIGTEDFNGYVKASAEVLTSDGKAAFEFEDDGEYSIGFDFSADAAAADAEAGLSFLSYKVDDGTATSGKVDNLFKVKAKADAGVGVHAAAYIESKTAIETDYVNINATTLKVGLKAFIGADVEVTVPTLAFKWPW